MAFIKIGRHEFNVEAVKSMSVSQFKKQFANLLGDNSESCYYRITGKKKPSKKKKESE